MRRRPMRPPARSSSRCRACRTCSRTGRTGSCSAAATSRPANCRQHRSGEPTDSSGPGALAAARQGRLVATRGARENSTGTCLGKALDGSEQERGGTRMEPRDQLVMLHGLRFHYREWGRPDAPPLVLLHGFSAHSRLWDYFARALVDHYHIFALDQRGHGETAWADEYSADLMIADLVAFVRALRLERFALIGHSMGGRNAYGYAAQHQETLSKLVLVDVGPEMPAGSSERFRRNVVQDNDVFDSPEEAFAAVRAANPFPPDDVLRARTLSGLMLRDDGRWTYRYDKALRDPARFRMPSNS